jgi:hypothetical protein
VAVVITAINISVYNIRIPARLQISTEYVRITLIPRRYEKVIYFITDACLKWCFIRTFAGEADEEGDVGV